MSAEATPLRLVDLTEGLPPAQLLAPPEPGEWSARDVLAHLRACADMRGKCIVEILSEDRPTIKAVNLVESSPATQSKQKTVGLPDKGSPTVFSVDTQDEFSLATAGRRDIATRR